MWSLTKFTVAVCQCSPVAVKCSHTATGGGAVLTGGSVPVLTGGGAVLTGGGAVLIKTTDYIALTRGFIYLYFINKKIYLFKVTRVQVKPKHRTKKLQSFVS